MPVARACIDNRRRWGVRCQRSVVYRRGDTDLSGSVYKDKIARSTAWDGVQGRLDE